MDEWARTIREQAREALPPVEGEIAVPGLREPVEVIRDRWGVPHIYAASLPDLMFAQGFVQGSERLFQVDFMLRLGNGRLSTMFADLALPLDRFFRAVGFPQIARRNAAAYDELSREMATSFTGGMAAWVDVMPAKPIEYRILDLEPQIPRGEDAAAYGAAGAVFLAWILSNNWDAELLRVEIAERLGWEAMLTLFPDLPTDPPATIPGKRGGGTERRSAMEILRTAPLQPSGQGSNNWVVDGSRTATGKPLLANDPHLVAQMPSIWFECHLSCPEMEVSGVALPFAPGVVIGRTAHHAWGFTNVGGDTQDLYLERLSEDGASALYGDTWEPLSIRRETIEVRGRPEPEMLEVRETRHGPILDSYMVGIANPEVVVGAIAETYSLRWAAAEGTTMPSTLFRMATAGDFGQFREAVRDWRSPGQNMVYADVDGNIGYQCTGLYPVRRQGDGTIPAPGWTPEHEWDGWIPFEELPWALNPDEGFLATANQRVHDDTYPFLIGHDFLPPYRARRIAALLSATDPHTKESFARMQVDTVSLPAREIVPLLLEIAPDDDPQKEALSLLAEWDGDLGVDSAGAALYEAWCKHIARAVLLPKLGEDLFDHFHGRRHWTNSFQYQALPSMLRFPSAAWFGGNGVQARDGVLRRALGDAIEELTAPLGGDMAAWRWGALHKVRFAHQLAMLPGLDELFVGGVVESGGDEQTILQGAFEPGVDYSAVVIPSWRQIIDLSDPDAAIGMHTTGQSGHPASEHWRDFVGQWSRGEYHPLPFTRPAVEGAAASRLVLAPDD